LVLLDIQMPVLDGYAVVREVRKTPRLACWRWQLMQCRETEKSVRSRLRWLSH